MNRRIKAIVFWSAIYIFLAYWAVTTDYEINLEGIRYGRPDPFILLAFAVATGQFSWYSFKSIWQEKSSEIATNCGGICVHSTDPAATFKPIDYYQIWEKQIINGNTLTAEVQIDVTQEIRNLVNERLKDTYEKYEYDPLLNYLEDFGIWCDGGIKVLGINGLRDIMGGEAVLTVPKKYVKKHGKDAICLAACKVYKGEELFQLPWHILAAVYQKVPQFNPGKHAIIYGTEPLPNTVRAWDVVNNQFLHTLGMKIKTINEDLRIEYLKNYEKLLDQEIKNLKGSLGWWDKYSQKKEPEPEPYNRYPDEYRPYGGDE